VHVACEHNKGYVGPRLKSSLQKVCGRRHELVDVKKYPLLKDKNANSLPLYCFNLF
jgi:hypothetical protein